MEEKLTTEQKVQSYIKLGKLVADMGNFEQAERVYKSALSIAEAEKDEENAIAGYALIELWDLYDKNGKEEEARAVWERLTRLLGRYYAEMSAENN